MNRARTSREKHIDASPHGAGIRSQTLRKSKRSDNGVRLRNLQRTPGALTGTPATAID
ncbi:hypothetical protein AS9A_P20031 (plasmid) [Hoyosella subflava DQS3-9A1]|uniref:Uncharacterized protein n=1 Tax=Hoyosella subflava (strain DSM 45089 / JCM 17490 / NBRC 109087 / DQS3-9A1) TaxID=443218 RepID=F6ESF4_HOYSD|nr:hypothetical protein AS9A_P20031 [Hoyosella subflava DQS3-9A1]